MFLSALSIEEKVKFLNLLNLAANIDGNCSDIERKQINGYITEMGLSDEQIIHQPQTVEEILGYFSTRNEIAKKIVFVEMTALIFADGEYTKSEENLVKQAQAHFSLSDDFRKQAIDWINEITPMYLKGFKMVGLI